MRNSSGYGPYREKYYQGDPWHLKPFLKGNRVTFPYEHDSVVLYTGVNKHIFFHKESDERPRKSRNAKSVLEQGELKPGNQGGGDPKAEGTATEGIFFGILPVAKNYATHHSHDSVGGAVLEIQIPSKILKTIVEKNAGPKEVQAYIQKKGSSPPSSWYNNVFKPPNPLEKMKEVYGSPNELRKRVLQAEEQGSKGEAIQWVVEQEIPLKYITGVWDVENSRKPVFSTFEEFLKNLKSQYGEHVPSDSNYISGLEVKKERKEILEEAEEYKDILDLVEVRLNTPIRTFGQLLNQIEQDGYDEDKGGRLIQRVDKYNERREELSEILETEFNVEDDSKPAIQLKNLPENLSEMEETIKSVEEGLKEAIADEQQHYQKENWSKKDIKKEQIFEERVEQELGELILKLPFIDYEEPREIIERT